MFRYFIGLYLIALTFPVSAQDWNLQSLNIQSLNIPIVQFQQQTLTAGLSPATYERAQFRHTNEDSYSYTYENSGSTSFGIFRLESGGQVCIDVGNNSGRCGLYVHSKGVMVMLAERGGHFPIRVQLDLRP